MNHATSLIKAIQTCNPAILKYAIDKAQQHERERVLGLEPNPSRQKYVPCSNVVNDSLETNMGIAAIHVAVKAWHAHRDDIELAEVFDEMTATLLNEGADLFQPFGVEVKKRHYRTDDVFEVVNPGTTIAQACQGKLPPSAQAYLAVRRFNEFAGNAHEYVKEHPQVKASREKRALETQAFHDSFNSVSSKAHSQSGITVIA